MDTFSLGSLGSGLDTNALISALLGIERLPSLRIQADRDRLTEETRFFDQLDARLDALRDAAGAVGSSGSLASYTATSSDESKVRASTLAGAAEGTHRLTVQQLARAHSVASKGVADPDADIGSATFAITVDGERYDVTQENGSLRDLAAAIEASGAPVTATVIDTGSGAEPHRLVVTADETGTANAITFDFGATPSLESTLGISTLQTAQDALLTVDGLAVTRSSNAVEDVVPGLRLELIGVTAPGEEIIVGVAPDDAALREKVQGFLDAYNAVNDLLGSRFVSPPEGQNAVVLFGDSGVRNIRSALRGAATDPTGTGGTFETLASVGIVTDSSGRLGLDATRFEDALAQDREGVLALFTDTERGVAQRLDERVDEFVAPGDGLVATRRDGISRRDRVLSQRLEVLDRRLLLVERRLIDRFANLERIVSQLNAQGAALGGL